MAARIAGFTTTTAVLGGTRVEKVRQWSIYSEPSETYFEIRAREVTTRDQVQGIADGVSATIEGLLGQGDVTDISWSQDVTPGGQLIGLFTVYWQTTDRSSSGFVEIPYTQFSEQNVQNAIFADAAGGGTITL